MKAFLAGIMIVLMTLVFTAGGAVLSADAAVEAHEQVPDEIQESPEEEADVPVFLFAPDRLRLRLIARPTANLYRGPVIAVLIRPPKTHA
ncbi:MAG: hypothetical protein KC897_01520 [Candidatus Omnitrophica bacterium]|nr:hypothetical protein [Candidatus Omnitrophota bacterium]MCB9720207.1 hypothetical protein [Candidatus Omnitrophota bacterium]